MAVTGSSQTLPANQIASLLYNAGVTNVNNLTTGVAVALAESGGRPGIINNTPSTEDYSVGLWQVNYFGSLLGPRSQAYGSPSTLQSSPMAQAAAASSISGGGVNWTPWTTFTSGAYKADLVAATQGVADFLGGNATAPVAGLGPSPQLSLTSAATSGGSGSTITGAQGQTLSQELAANPWSLTNPFGTAGLFSWLGQSSLRDSLALDVISIGMILVGAWLLLRQELPTPTNVAGAASKVRSTLVS